MTPPGPTAILVDAIASPASMGVTSLAPTGDTDRAENVWDSLRWARLWDTLFYVTLALPTVLNVTVGEGSARSRAVTAAVAAAFGAWYWVMLVLHREWWGRLGPALVYLAGAVVCFWLLVSRDTRFFILVYSLYPQVFGLLPGGWSFLGAAGVPLLPFLTAGRLGNLDAGDLLTLAANLALALLVGLFIRAIAGQSERRREIIAELERARAENAELLARVRETAVLDERQRMAREIHDTLAQGLTGIVTQLEAAEAALQDRPAAARGHLDTARRLARESLGEARRSVQALRPGPLEDGRLVDALADVAARWAADRGVPAAVTTVGEPRPLPSETEVTLLRVAQEALANAGRHAGASAVALTLAFADGQVSLDVTDDGVGFDPAASPAGNGSAGGFGLTAMRERVAALKGSLDVESDPGQGTTVVATLPAAEPG
jgi:signal transduction histidine kinase